MAIPEAAAAFLSTGLISLAPNVLLFLFPNYAATSSQSPRNKALLSLGQALAVGGLLGDVFLHTLPDCFVDSSGHHHHHGHSASHEHHGHDSHHDHHHQHSAGEDVGVRVLVGFATFLILDIFVRSLEGGHSHNHSHAKTNGHCNGSANKQAQSSRWRLVFSSAVLLNLLGDALHNFTDGLAIGATFSSSHIPSHNFEDSSTMSYVTSAFALLKSRGGLASMSVFLHEIPHELGDFATLVNAGMSRNMAIGMQFVTAIAAFMGTALGLFSSRIIEGLDHDVLLPFTAGGFVYLACTTILPEILEMDVNLYVRLLQICSFALGLAFMYAVGVLEGMEGHHGDETHHHVHQSHGEL